MNSFLRKILLGSSILVLVIGSLWMFRSQVRGIYNISRTLLDFLTIKNDESTTDIIFIHHSTGRGLISEGNVRELFSELGYEFWDHDYNFIGLTRSDGSLSGYSYNIPNDNTDPDGLAYLFSQSVRKWPVNAFSAILQHDVIVFKSCFPVSNISSQEQLDVYKHHYLNIREVIRQYPEHSFVVVTPPPLVSERTTQINASRAREFADWLKSDEYISGYDNLYAFDFFDLLAGDDPSSLDYNTLRTEFRSTLHGDSHPNALANQMVGPKFIEFISRLIEQGDC